MTVLVTLFVFPVVLFRNFAMTLLAVVLFCVKLQYGFVLFAPVAFFNSHTL
jgi:hypothetical protein